MKILTCDKQHAAISFSKSETYDQYYAGNQNFYTDYNQRGYHDECPVCQSIAMIKRMEVVLDSYLQRIKELEKSIEKRSKEDNLKEIIIALSLNPQGEHTDMYLREILSPIEKKYNLRIVSLGRGLSTGTELEYSDNETIKNALKNRS